jgi:hypothetical protein
MTPFLNLNLKRLKSSKSLTTKVLVKPFTTRSLVEMNLVSGSFSARGARYAWTNCQLNLVCSALDIVFVSASFEAFSPLCSLATETSLGSDHTRPVFGTGKVYLSVATVFFSKQGGLRGRILSLTRWQPGIGYSPRCVVVILSTGVSS